MKRKNNNRANNKSKNNVVAINNDVGGVTPSNVVLQINTRNEYNEKEEVVIGIDKGLAQGDDGLEKNISFLDWVVDILLICSTFLITHVHIDHVGMLPDVEKSASKEGRDVTVYATEGTKLWLKHSLLDSLYLRLLQVKAKRTAPLHREQDVEKTLEDTKVVRYEETFYLTKNIAVTYFYNGHILASAMILVQVLDLCNPDNDINLFFTGDYKPDNYLGIVKSLPDWVKELDLIIFIESTYGDKRSEEVKHEIFEEKIMSTINESKGSPYCKIIVPVFSVELAQKLIAILCKMDIPNKFKIILDGDLAQKQTRIVLDNPDAFNIKKEERNFVSERVIWGNTESREQYIRSKNIFAIIVVSGGMLNGTSKRYIEKLASDPYTTLFLIGYKPKGNVGHVLSKANKGDVISIYGKEVILKATVYWTREYSSHAMQEELIEFLCQFKKIPALFVMHGETKAREALIKEVKKHPILKKTVKEVHNFNYSKAFMLYHHGILKEMETLKK